jgi:hypothetical protein
MAWYLVKNRDNITFILHGMLASKRFQDGGYRITLINTVIYIDVSFKHTVISYSFLYIEALSCSSLFRLEILTRPALSVAALLRTEGSI